MTHKCNIYKMFYTPVSFAMPDNTCIKLMIKVIALLYITRYF